MKPHNVIPMFLVLLSLFTQTAYADGYSTGTTDNNTQSTTYSSYNTQTPPPNEMPPPSGYTVQSDTPPAPPAHRHHRQRDGWSVSVKLSEPLQTTTHSSEVRRVVITNSKPHHNLAWVTISQGDRLPRYVVTGGYQPYPAATLYVCRAAYRGGMHPGKLYRGTCNIGWGGNEIIARDDYDVLTSRHPLRWVSASYGAIPSGAIEGGYQHDGRLYICQARYRGGMHPGKLYKEHCLIGWGGEEIAIPEYYVLTR